MDTDILYLFLGPVHICLSVELSPTKPPSLMLEEECDIHANSMYDNTDFYFVLCLCMFHLCANLCTTSTQYLQVDHQRVSDSLRKSDRQL